VILAIGFGLGRWTAPGVLPPAPAPTPIGDKTPVAGRPAEGVPVPQEATLEDVLQLAREGLTELQKNINDYTAHVIKQERIGGILRPPEEMDLKLQTEQTENGKVIRPMRVYLRFTSPVSMAGQEVIWDPQANDNKLVAHGAGLLNVMRVSLKPDSFLAMTGNRYPITQIGLTNLVRKLIERGELDQQTAAATVSITEGHLEGDRECKLIRVVHTEPTGRPDDFSLAEIAIDSQRQIPLRYTAFGWPEEGSSAPPLLESYTYLDVELNVGLTDADFDPDNPDYDFP